MTKLDEESLVGRLRKGDETTFIGLVNALQAKLVRFACGNVKHLNSASPWGLRKIDRRWTIVHEHHSVPAE